MYELGSDIDCKDFPFQTIESFSSVLDGKGHSISNLALIDENTSIFTSVDNSVIKNINFKNFLINSTENSVCLLFIDGYFTTLEVTIFQLFFI